MLDTGKIENIDISFNTLGLPYLLSALLIITVLNTFSFMLIFIKCEEPAWKAFIPIYRNMTYLDLGSAPKWLGILSYTPLFPIYAIIFTIATQDISKRFKYDAMMTYVGVICFPIYGLIIFFAHDSYMRKRITPGSKFTSEEFTGEDITPKGTSLMTGRKVSNLYSKEEQPKQDSEVRPWRHAETQKTDSELFPEIDIDRMFE